ncbi:aromatic amino acid ammonia-lyase [Actinoplanes friuliensis]|uniref:Putative phenylalanine/histidine ammonia-lyase n=1 Tax=Actinoplanes friuliensis DSM 7358 TaxID=1246995 RepID=U5VXL5_9ACTN|nr:aromatic amino acid ammonia-lyase [Actinoplanes friuliensis]AGZ41589.1 putative phenylalanine/histidine ammonia-lyase [Actinoplanes friuliensis DSM 7358]
MQGDEVRLDGRTLTPEGLTAIASGHAGIAVDPAALRLVEARHAVMRDARERGTVYGANTGVGANRHETAGTPDVVDHGLRLLRSHCAGSGPVEDNSTARAAMAVRLNQILAGGSGISLRVTEALVAALRSGAVPALHRWGAIGTADLAALAELGLTLAGERPWRSGAGPVTTIDATDALPMISSSALTVATAALALTEVHQQLRASTVVAALSFLALRGNPEAYDAVVHAGRTHPSQSEVAALLRELVAGCSTPARIQDPFGLRVVPQVTAPALHAVHELRRVLTTELNAAAENPLVTTEGVRHHGQFHTATLSAGLDAVRGAYFPALSLSVARLGLLMRPDLTGLRAFLAAGPAGSSGLMISEYVVQDVLAEIRVIVPPVLPGTLSISLGLEEHASFATQGARSLRTMAGLAPVLLAAELVAAVRALRMVPERLTGGTARRAFEIAAEVLDDGTSDRPLGTDLERAAKVLPLLVGDGFQGA